MALNMDSPVKLVIEILLVAFIVYHWRQIWAALEGVLSVFL